MFALLLTWSSLNAINYIFLRESCDNRVSFFFVDRDDSNSLCAETIIRSVSRQSLDFNVGGAYIEDKLRTLRQALFVDLKTWVSLLRLVVEQSTVHFIFIDGLDECDAAERRCLLDALSSVIASSLDLRIFIASCASVSIDLRRISLPMQHISMDGDHLALDICTYVDASIEARV